MVQRIATLVSLIAALAGCTSDLAERPPEEQPSRCADPLELALQDGSCIRPGIPPGGCGEGFEHDGEYGCEPILPAEPCPPGLMAVPGDSECRPVMECGQGTWGELPVDPATVYVDDSYLGGDGDGTEGRPWPTIGDAVAAAAPGALIAVAAGTYQEDVVIVGKPVQLRGVCPDDVAIVGTGASNHPSCPPGALCLGPGASGTVVSGLSLSGAAAGINMSGAVNVLIDRVHVHDNPRRGVNIDGALGATSVEVRRSLIERNEEFGLIVIGAHGTIDASVVRTTGPGALYPRGGGGIYAHLSCVETPTGTQCDPAGRASVSVNRSLVEQNHEYGLFVASSDLTVEASVVRDTLPRESNQMVGIGIGIQNYCIETSMGLQCDREARPSVSIRGSLVEKNHVTGINVSGSSAIVAESVVRDTLPAPGDQSDGAGIDVQLSCLRTALGGQCDPEAPSSFVMQHSLIERNHAFGLLVGSSHATVETSVVRAISARADDGLFGDGIAVVSERAPASATVTATRIEESARAGFGVFGAQAALVDTRIRCAAFALVGEQVSGSSAELEDGGGNLCGCPDADSTCALVSAGLEPPEPAGASD